MCKYQHPSQWEPWQWGQHIQSWRKVWYVNLRMENMIALIISTNYTLICLLVYTEILHKYSTNITNSWGKLITYPGYMIITMTNEEINSTILIGFISTWKTKFPTTGLHTHILASVILFAFLLFNSQGLYLLNRKWIKFRNLSSGNLSCVKILNDKA